MDGVQVLFLLLQALLVKDLFQFSHLLLREDGLLIGLFLAVLFGPVDASDVHRVVNNKIMSISHI
jgi:hypothetical protein